MILYPFIAMEFARPWCDSHCGAVEYDQGRLPAELYVVWRVAHLMKYIISVFLLLISSYCVASGNFNESDCQKLLIAIDQVSYPEVILELDGVFSQGFILDERAEVKNYGMLKYPKQDGIYTGLRIAKIKSDFEEKSIVDLAEYLGLDLNKTPFTYWDSIVYFIRRLDGYSGFDCSSLDEQGKLDLVVFHTISLEVLFPAKGPSRSLKTPLLAHNFADGYYYVVFKFSDGELSIELKINIGGDTYTMTVYGNDRKKLESFVASVIQLNVQAP